ncbi:hypothetical protein K227x_04160 [Rubripirellula lacrimiformis]|uniref:Nucleotidyltransferase n=1 Tax=Rubripirellula lacrimiformis TaxID=1930273 RepID=A0A517N4I3_9BACT|nr:hypothetical protein [Rubripirellula lacrimiformis]QDT02045.1 hypothetical protein K227x_04160 [Rubripirellula lacrimiformis]
MLNPDVQTNVDWFVARVKESLQDNLRNVTVYGPAVTSIYDARKHQIHPLIVVESRSVDRLLALAAHSKGASKRRIGPPLIVTDRALRQSCDVFPLEWIDIAQFHETVFGDPVLADLAPQASHVRLQCERDLRSLDILLQRGILASGGKPQRIDRLEQEASDSMIRVLRGIGWLSGDRLPLLPDALCTRCQEIVEFPLPGCSEAIRVDGRHDVETVGLLLEEIGLLSAWIDDHQMVDP